MARTILTPDLRRDEVDLRTIAKVIKRRYLVIVGISIVAILVGIAGSLLTPRTYEAHALLAVTRPQYVLSFSPPFQPGPNQNPDQLAQASIARVLATLALSDDILKALISSGSVILPQSTRTVDDLRRALNILTTSDPSLIALSVRSPDPVQASALANAWADQVVARTNSIYGQSSGSLTDYESRTAVAGTDLMRAETALADFEAHNQLNILQSQLQALIQEQQMYLSDREGTTRLIDDVQGLRQQLSTYPADAKVSLGDDLTTLLLETKAFNASAGVPIQLQVTGTQGVSAKTAGESVAFLDDLETRLKSESTFDQSRIDAISPTILRLQGQVQQAKNDEDRLTTDRNTAQETVHILAQQTDEVRSAALGNDEQVKIASRASPSLIPVSPRIVLNTAVAAVIGLMLGLLAAFIQESWGVREEISATIGTGSQFIPDRVPTGVDRAAGP